MAISSHGKLVCDKCRDEIEDDDEITCEKCLALIKKHIAMQKGDTHAATDV